ncbi:hypothetical protein SteCoe_6807 [Stentor coeruleus]|uniref:ADP/ATP translocase n=1 Tax=Stentor coeruleus TaxID=5963 RepID=A0A1R2CP33_9CILI|nr:hypothetical protein SteCoe_6807 [Stentor coeruleus]
MELYLRQRDYWTRVYDYCAVHAMWMVASAPLERIKKIIQTQNCHPGIHPEHRFKNSLWAAEFIIKKQGFFSLWRGSLLPICITLPNHLYCDWFQNNKNYIKVFDNHKNPFLARAEEIAKNLIMIFGTGIIFYPMLMIGVQLSVDRGTKGNFEHKSIYDCFKKISSRPIEMYRGIFSTMFIPMYIGGYYMSKSDAILDSINSRENVIPSTLSILGWISAVNFGVMLLKQPFEVLQNRLMIQAGRENQAFTGPMNCIAKSLKDEGFIVFTRGLTLNFFISIIGFTIQAYYFDAHQLN